MQQPRKPQTGQVVAEPPAWHTLPLLHASTTVGTWLDHYWLKMGLPASERWRVAITQDRREFARWTGRRLNPLSLGCYCYLPGTLEDGRAEAYAHAAGVATLAGNLASMQLPLPGIEGSKATITTALTNRHRHLIFIEPDLLELGVEVTVAHELIHLSDRVKGNPRRHVCHGYDAIAADEATITGYDPELLRQLLRDETSRREAVLRQSRPIKYLYVCPHCGKQYPRVKRYARPVSCGACAREYDPNFLLVQRPLNEVLPSMPII